MQSNNFVLSGPSPLPFIGNLHQVLSEDSIVFKSFHKISLKYGPVVRLWFGPKLAFLVSGVDELKVQHNVQFHKYQPITSKSPFHRK